MTTEVIPIFAALLGVLVGGIVSAIISKLQHKHQKLLETYKRKIDKLESLYELLDEINIYYQSQLERVIEACVSVEYLEKNKNSTPTLSGSLEEKFNSESVPNFNQLKMLVAIYAEELTEKNEALIKECRQRFPLVTMNVLIKRDRSSDNEKPKGELVESYAKIYRYTEVMQASVLKSINCLLDG